MPAIWKDAVREIKKSSPDVNPYAVATASLQKAHELRKGTREATKSGEKRGEMTKAERHEHPLHPGRDRAHRLIGGAASPPRGRHRGDGCG